MQGATTLWLEVGKDKTSNDNEELEHTEIN